jgi:hypothetical protein
MIEHAWTLLCTKCVTDPDSRNATLVEVVEQINAPADAVFPAVVPLQLDLVSVWYRTNPETPATGTGRVTLIPPTGEAGPPTEYAIDLSVFYRSRNLTRSGGIALGGLGIYYFQIEYRENAQAAWKIVSKLPLNVAAVTPNP